MLRNVYNDNSQSVKLNYVTTLLVIYWIMFQCLAWFAMGSEQSQQAAAAAGSSQSNSTNSQQFNQRPASSHASRLQRGYTIAAPTSDSLNNTRLVDASPSPLDSRPVSPPMSICSDSDLPYISYTDKPIGGEISFIKGEARLICFPY